MVSADIESPVVVHVTALKLVNFRANVNFFFAYLQAQISEKDLHFYGEMLIFTQDHRPIKENLAHLMQRFAFILTLFSGGFLLAALILTIFQFDPNSLQNLLTSDGSFDPLAIYAFSSLKTGLLIAGLVLLLFSWLFHRASREEFSPLKWSTRRFLSSILGVQFTISLLYVSLVQYVPNGDSEWYHRQAVNIARGIGVTTQLGDPTAFWPIGYPFLLSIFYRVFGSEVIIGQLLNIFFFCAMTLMIYLIGRNLYDEKSARLSAIITALIPSQIFYALNPLADIPFSFIVLFILYLIIKKPYLKQTFQLGIVIGIGNMFRPNLVFFPILIAIFRYLREKKFIPAFTQMIIILILSEAAMLPWQVRNYKIFNRFIMVSNNAGYNLAMGNNDNATGGVLGLRAFVPEDTLNYYKSLNEADQDKFLSKLGIDYIKAHPGRFVKLAFKKLMHLYIKDSKGVTYGLRESYSQFSPSIIMSMIAITEGFYYSLLIAFLSFIFHFCKMEGLKPSSWLLLAPILYFTLIFLPFISEGRYHMPLLPIFALIVVYTGTMSASEKRHRLG
jgi:hypothetical protein